jgi:hypothetical protein
MLCRMRPPIFVRSLTSAERSALEAGLRSGDAFILRRCQIVLASARGHAPPHIAQHLGCNDQTVRNAIRAFNTAGLACLRRRSSRPHTVQAAFDPARAERPAAPPSLVPRPVGA